MIGLFVDYEVNPDWSNTAVIGGYIMEQTIWLYA